MVIDLERQTIGLLKPQTVLIPSSYRSRHKCILSLKDNVPCSFTKGARFHKPRKSYICIKNNYGLKSLIILYDINTHINAENGDFYRCKNKTYQ